MVKTGGRTGYRVGVDLFNAIKGKRAPNNSELLCKAICEVYCTTLDGVRTEINKPRPDHTMIPEKWTDWRTVADLLEAGKCSCECNVGIPPD